jgi:hypothetical protein
LHNEEFYDLYFLPNIVWVIKSRRMRWAEHVVCIPGKGNAHNVGVGKPEGEGLLGRPRYRWVHNIKVIFRTLNGRAWSGFI